MMNTLVFASPKAFNTIRHRRIARNGRRIAFLAAAMLGAIGGFDPSACQAQLRVEVEAISGVPFGVGRATLLSGGEFRLDRRPRLAGARGGRIADLAKRIMDQTGNSPPPSNLASSEIGLVEKSGRTFYPVFEKRDRPILREFITVPTQNTVYFLFQGDAPLELTIYTSEAEAAQVVPRQDPAGHERLLRAWWREYSAAASGRNAPKDFPPLVEEYLTDTLSRRLQLPLPKQPRQRESSLFQSELNLLFGTEAARQEITRTILLGDAPAEPATEPVPEELPRPKPESLNPATAPVEPLAMHVPEECLYVRFGSFSNFLWLRHRLEDWGGELRDVVSERGLSYGLNDRMQRQLGLRESALAELLGERVIADVALIGTDTFLREGAAIGMLFQAKSNTALSTDLMTQRLTALKEAKGGTQEKVLITGQQVSLVSTPDNSLRSFYVADGDFHLVTTSRTLVEWFLLTGAGKHDSLGASDEFRYARTNMPLQRNDTVFVYLSPAFFQNLLSPQYHIELDRRLRSAVEMELFAIAQLAAQAEHKPGDTIEELIAGGLLPSGFGTRSDGSHLEIVNGEIRDSLRGGHGTFLPVPDVQLNKITRTEAQDYRQFSEVYVSQWGPLDPVVAGVQRQALPQGNLERVVLDIEAAPLSQQHSQMLDKWLGPPTDQRLAPVPGDVAAFEAVMRGGSFFSGGDHHLFGALRNADPSLAMDPRTSLITRFLTSSLDGVQGYLGAWPNAGFLRMLGGTSDIPPDPAGYSQLRTGLWRRQFDQFTMLSFHPEILAQASSELHFEKAERPAQIWIRADDLANSTLAPMLNAYGYRQSRQISLGNTRFMNMLTEQLHVAPAEGRAVAERLLDAKLESPLGGQYELRQGSNGMNQWVATALSSQSDPKQPPADYQFPALNWLRGIKLEVRTMSGLLALHGEVIMPVEARPASGFQFPTLPFGGGAKPAAKPVDPKPAKPVPAPPAPSSTKGSGKREL